MLQHGTEAYTGHRKQVQGEAFEMNSVAPIQC